MKTVVAHFRSQYLPISETFIYWYITNIQKYRCILLTRELTNLSLFPFHSLHCEPKLKRYSLRRFCCRSLRKFFKRELYFEYIIKKEQAKLIHAHFGPEGVEMLGIKKRLRLPLVTTFYGFDMSMLARDKKWQKAYETLFKEGDLFFVEGDHMRQCLIKLGCPAAKLRIQHIAIDVSKYKYQEHRLKAKDEKIIILFCGRFIEKKGLIYALKAVKLAHEKFPNLEFRIFGDGKLRPGIEDFIKEQNMLDYVILLGFQPHNVLLEELGKSDILLQPSVLAQNGDSEGGAPTILLEAQASGMPVVSTYHADIPEVVIDFESGFLVPERNSEELAEKIKSLIADPDLCQGMGRRGRRHVEENYNIRNEVVRLESTYDTFLSAMVK